MSRFILRYTGKGNCPPDDVNTLRDAESVKIIDDSSPRMLLVEAAENDLKDLMGKMAGWIVTPERFIKPPDPRPRVKE